MVDLSHANSSKDHERQKVAAAAVAEQLQTAQGQCAWVMIESHLVAGKQSLSDDLTYGQSITDACIGWDDTVVLLDQFLHQPMPDPVPSSPVYRSLFALRSQGVSPLTVVQKKCHPRASDRLLGAGAPSTSIR